MIQEGQTAPDFALPGVEGGEPAIHELFRPIEGGDTVLVWFVPATFLPTATAELSAIQFAGWHDIPGLRVWVLSMDSIHASAAYADQHDLSMTFLGDAASVAGCYGVRQEEWEGHYGAPKRAVFLIDSDWSVAFTWTTEDAFEAVDPSPVACVGVKINVRFPDATTDVAVDYAAHVPVDEA
jgi:peroxiredoxin